MTVTEAALDPELEGAMLRLCFAACIEHAAGNTSHESNNRKVQQQGRAADERVSRRAAAHDVPKFGLFRGHSVKSDQEMEPDDLAKIACDAADKYVGQIGQLESAIGAMFVANMVGWRPLLLVHRPKTVEKYEEILGVSFREIFPEVGPRAKKSLAWRVYMAKETVFDYWSHVRGQVQIPRKTELDNRR